MQTQTPQESALSAADWALPPSRAECSAHRAAQAEATGRGLECHAGVSLADCSTQFQQVSWGYSLLVLECFSLPGCGERDSEAALGLWPCWVSSQLRAVALCPYTFLSLHSSCRMLWAAVLVGQPFVGVNMLLPWLCKGFLPFSSLLRWFKWAEQYAKLSLWPLNVLLF